MPLNTQIKRDGETLALRWGHFHVAAMVLACMADAPQRPEHHKIDRMLQVWRNTNGDVPMPISPGDVHAVTDYSIIGTTLLNSAPYTLQNDYSFVDPMDNEVFELKAGDVLSMHRSSR